MVESGFEIVMPPAGGVLNTPLKVLSPQSYGTYIYDVHTERFGVWELKFVTSLQILLFLIMDLLFVFVDVGWIHKIGHFLQT